MATNERILFELKSRGEMTTAALAERFGISAQAVRQHMARLADDGLVGWRDEVTGKGRPRRHWRLTEAAADRFPDTHAQLTVELIDAVRGELGEAALESLLARRERDNLARYRERVAGRARLRDRVAALARQRAEEGYMAEWHKQRDGSFLLVENHCPICAAASACQGFCRAELATFRAVLGPDCTVERTEHIPAGARRCAYRIVPAS